LNLSNPSSLLPGLARGSRLLILRLRSLGDIVLLTPALAALHAFRSDLLITVAVEPEFAAVLEGNPAVNEILLVRGLPQTAREIRRRRFSIVFNQHAGPTSAFLTALSGAPARVCWEGRQFSFFYNVLAPAPEHFFGLRPIHSVEQRIAQFYWTGLEPGAIPATRVFPQTGALSAAAKKLVDRGLPGGQPYAVIHPGAAYFTKRWAPEEFAAVAQWLREDRGIFPAIILGPDEADVAEEIREKLRPHAILFEPGKLDLSELIALISQAQIFVGNDSGPAHLAAASGRPTVVIFGSSNSSAWRPWQTSHRIVQNDFPCNPCPGDRCYAFAEPRCILSVAVEQVQEACAALLDTTTDSHLLPAAGLKL
jgi:ADP-heptose:LPS heptosyltransferase